MTDTHDHPPTHITEQTVDPGVHHVHVVPMKVIVGVLVVMLVLTWLTVAATYIDLGDWNVWIALVIALVKGSLVAAYFMHLRYDSPFHAMVLVTALLFVVIFVGIAMVDSLHYHPAIEAYQQDLPVRK